MAGMSFNFAGEMLRKTLNRSQITELIQGKFNEVTSKTQLYTDQVHFKMDTIMMKEAEMKKQIIAYQEETRTYIKEFIEIQVRELKEKGFQM